VAVIAFLSPQLIAAEPAVREPTNTPSSWEFSLSLIGIDLKCYFTLEKVERDGDDPKAQPVYIMDDEVYADLDDALAKLRKQVKGFTFIKSKEHKNVIHVIETCLLKTPEYSLDKKVSIVTSGTPYDLVSSLERYGTGVECRRSGTNTSASTYRVIKQFSWQKLEDIAGDNKNDDGSTNLSWNLE
jgi:hypothetical protein